ncbi:transcriptional repressor CTCF-like [Culicoides brevitarsis]|uniref:transcriptional repressor CTCF-like n=1 Tax=Culicoides brevitarsis TaxID=469753 RepID=UPI00307B6382
MMELTSESDWICRCCLEIIPAEDEKYNNLLEIANFVNVSYLKVFEAVSGYEVNAEEPQKLCLPCSEKLLTAFELKKICDKTQKILNSRLKNVKNEVKVEIFELPTFEDDFREEDVDSFPHKKKKSRRKSSPKASKPPKNEKKLCPICGIFRSAKHVQEHIDRSSNVDTNGVPISRPFTCDLCGRQTASRNNMFLHMQTKHLRVTLKCKHCKAEFRNRGRLETHMRKIHTEIKGLLECKFCEFRAVDRSTLHVHMKKHTGLKPHRCEICHHEFITKTKWRDHVATHSDERPFACETCNATFKTRKTLNSHKKIHMEHDYECPVCSHTYQTSHQLRQHVTKQHKEYPLPPPGTVLSKSWRKRKAEQEMKDLAMKQGKDQKEIEAIRVEEVPSISEKLYFQGFG